MDELGIALQKTLKSAIHCRGVALHSGARVAMTLHPAAPDTGIVFRRTDRAGAEIKADWRNAVEQALCTRLDNGEGLSVATIEHLMAALAGLEIDNALIELDGPEVPVMDGSAAPFVFLLEVDQMRAVGLARGGSLENAVVINGDRVLNREGLRYVDEFVRHKVLDALGDLYLAGSPVIGHFHGVRSGHALNRRLLEALFADSSAWCSSAMVRRVPEPVVWEEQPQRARA